MKRILTLVAVLGVVFGMTGMSLLGCTTAAQNRAEYIRQNLPLVLEKNKECPQNIIDSPNYQPVAKRLAIKNIQNPTLAQLTDSGFVSDEEISVIINAHNAMAICREQLIKDHMDVNPGVIPILTQSWLASDIVTADLITRKITFGEAVKRRSGIFQEMGGKLNAQRIQLDRDLAAAHYAELQQVDEAVNALSQWSYRQQTLMQNQQLNQQLINAVNRPVTTNCFRVGNSVQCTSY